MDNAGQPPPKMLIIAGGIFLVLVLVVFAVVSSIMKNRDSETSVQPTPAPGSSTSSNPSYEPPEDIRPGSTGSSGTAGDLNNPDQYLAKVGEERIFQTDVDYLKELYSGNPNEVSQDQYLKKLAQDSAILQGAAAAGLVELDPEFYDTPEKNQLMRQKKLQDVRQAIDKSENTISGVVISIWFANETPPKIGYEQAKKVALEKISALHADVKSNKITIEQAGQRVQSDTSLADLDIVYDVNAIYKFSRSQGEQITLSTDFDEMLWKTPQGGVTDVYLAKATPTYSDKEMDALYMFGQIKTKKTNGSFTNFDDWTVEQEKKYVLKKK